MRAWHTSGGSTFQTEGTAKTLKGKGTWNALGIERQSLWLAQNPNTKRYGRRKMQGPEEVGYGRPSSGLDMMGNSDSEPVYIFKSFLWQLHEELTVGRHYGLKCVPTKDTLES